MPRLFYVYMFNPLNFISTNVGCWYDHAWDSAYGPQAACTLEGGIFYGHILVGVAIAFIGFVSMSYFRADPQNTKTDRYNITEIGSIISIVSGIFLPIALWVIGHHGLLIASVIVSSISLIYFLRGILTGMEKIRRNEFESPFKKVFYVFNVNRRLDARIHKKQRELEQIEAQLLVARNTLPEYREFDDSLTSSYS